LCEIYLYRALVKRCSEVNKWIQSRLFEIYFHFALHSIAKYLYVYYIVLPACAVKNVVGSTIIKVRPDRREENNNKKKPPRQVCRTSNCTRRQGNISARGIFILFLRRYAQNGGVALRTAAHGRYTINAADRVQENAVWYILYIIRIILLYTKYRYAGT